MHEREREKEKERKKERQERQEREEGEREREKEREVSVEPRRCEVFLQCGGVWFGCGAIRCKVAVVSRKK